MKAGGLLSNPPFLLAPTVGEECSVDANHPVCYFTEALRPAWLEQGYLHMMPLVFYGLQGIGEIRITTDQKRNIVVVVRTMNKHVSR